MQRTEVSGFSARSAKTVGATALISLFAAFYLLLVPGERSAIESVDADGYSRSAIGHLGLLNLLRESGEAVVQMRYERSIAPDALLVLAEPRDLDEESLERVGPLVDRAAASLLVLQKRTGARDPDRRDWIAHAELVDLDVVTRPLALFAARGAWQTPRVRRVEAATGWSRPNGWPAPVLVEPVQLIAADSPGVEPLVACDQGVLVARIGDLHVLSDPDLVANHGLLRGENAELALGLFGHLRGVGAVVFDETTHGYRMAPSIWHEAGRFPLVLVPVHLLLAGGLLLWIASGRFGRPARVRPAIGAGKAFLIDNIAALLGRGGSDGPSLRRFLRQRVRRAAERMHAPAGLDDDACRDWLLRRTRDKDVREELQQLLGRELVDLRPGQAVTIARRVHDLTEDESHVTG